MNSNTEFRHNAVMLAVNLGAEFQYIAEFRPCIKASAATWFLPPDYYNFIAYVFVNLSSVSGNSFVYVVKKIVKKTMKLQMPDTLGNCGGSNKVKKQKYKFLLKRMMIAP